MRSKLLKILKKIEETDGYKNEYEEYFEYYDAEYSITEYTDFPTYSFIIRVYNSEYPVISNGIINPVSENALKSELRRMENDGLIMISIQTGNKYGHSSTGPDIENMAFKCESVVLTTRGKDWCKYARSVAMENPVSFLFSLIALITSFLALFY